MAIVRSICVLVSTLCMVFYASGKIHSTETMERSTDQWIDLNSGYGNVVKRSILNQRLRRASTTKLQPVVNEFELQNDTTHNQALIHWSGNGSEVIFILTRKKSSAGSSGVTVSTLWRSENYGKTYRRMADAFDSKTVLKSYFISPMNKTKCLKQVIFVDTFNQSRRIWRSLDEGVTYRKVDVPFSVEKIDFHPIQSDWLLGYDKSLKELYCSMDFGLSWRKLGDEVTSDRYYWYVKDVDEGAKAEKIVFFEYRHFYSAILNRIYKVKSCYIPDCSPTPFQKHLDDLEQIDSESLVVQHSYVFVQKSGAANKLYVSHNRGPFSKAVFPNYATRSQAHFHIVSSDDGCVVIGINHDNGLTHLFFSDVAGKRYSQSLSNLRYFNKKSTDNKVFSVDIYKIQGIIGTFVANVHNSDGHNTTKITWDNGRSWSDIVSGVYDRKGVEKTQRTCDQCSLNLHLTMEQTPTGYYMQSILAKSSHPGIVLAHGTYGRTVQDRPSEVSLFLSRDNGRTWHLIQEQRQFVVVSNHGAVIVTVRMIFAQPVTAFSFSSDYGRTWSEHNFIAANKMINVDGILTEPGEKKPLITLFGHETYHDSWKVYQVDVTPLFPKVCTHPADFENVSVPFGGPTKQCHLGMKQQFERLKHESHCLVPPTYARVNNVEKCPCTRDDYECDLGYNSVMKGVELECEPERLGTVDEIGVDLSQIHENIVRDDRAKCDRNNERNVSTGLRKVPGNQCVGDVADIYFRMEKCSEEARTSTLPPTTRPPVLIKRQNSSNILKIGDVVVFSVQGVQSGGVVWKVSNKDKLSNVTDAHEQLNFHATEPGEYTIRAEVAGTSYSSQWESVQFWYPIKKVRLYHPPVVAQSRSYNVTAWTQTVHGLRGHRTLVGDVGYIWDIDAENQNSIPISSTENTYSGKPPNHAGSAVEITVTADNRVSQQSTTGKILVKEYAVEIVMEMECTPALTEANMTDEWLQDFRQIVANELLLMDAIQVIKTKYSLTNEISLYVYVAPSYPLNVYIYLAPTKKVHSRDKLLEAAKQIEEVLVDGPFSVLLAGHMTAKMTKLYIIDYDGVVRMYEPYSVANTTLIVIIVMLVLLVLVAGLLVFRHFSRKKRFGRYLHFRNLRPGGPGGSRIVRSQDRSPIVDEEFIDDDLNAMEDIGNRDSSLQFQG